MKVKTTEEQNSSLLEFVSFFFVHVFPVGVTPPSRCGNCLVIEKEKRTLMESSENIRG